MRDLNDLMYFAAVVEHGGFTAASRVLGLPKSTLSRRVSGLETRLDVRLLQRSTRRLAVTEIGQQFYAHCKAMMAEADTAESVVASTHAEPCGSLNIVCPVALLHMQVADMVASFALRYPLVKLHVSAMNRAVDLIGEGVDIALRVRPLPLPDTDLVMRKLGESAQWLVASPELMRRLGQPRNPQDLANWPSLGNGNMSDIHSWSWTRPDEADRPAGEAVTLQHWPRLSTTDMHTLRCAAIAGVGVVQLPAAFVQNELTAGTLVQVLPAWQLPPQVIHAIFASRRGLAASVRAFLDHLVAGFEVHSTMLAALGKSSGKASVNE